MDVVDDANAGALRFSVRWSSLTSFLICRTWLTAPRATLIREVTRYFIHLNYHLTRAGGDDFRNAYMELRRLKR